MTIPTHSFTTEVLIPALLATLNRSARRCCDDFAADLLRWSNALPSVHAALVDAVGVRAGWVYGAGDGDRDRLGVTTIGASHSLATLEPIRSRRTGANTAINFEPLTQQVLQP